MKNFHFAPAPSLRSSADILANAGQVIPEKKTPWSLQKAVPHHVLVARATAERKEQQREIADNMRENFYADKAARDAVKNAPKGIFAQTVEGGFKVIGFGVTVPTVAEIFTLATQNNRAFVKVDGKEVTSPE